MRRGRPGHRHGAAYIVADDGFVGDRVAGPALAHLRRVDVRRPAELAIPALNDELRHEAVEHDVGVVTALRQRNEIAGGDGGELALHLDRDRARWSGDCHRSGVTGAEWRRLRAGTTRGG